MSLISKLISAPRDLLWRSMRHWISAVGVVLAEGLPVVPVPAFAEVKLYVERISLEPTCAGEHEDGFKPLLAVDYVVDEFSIDVPLVEKNARQW